MSDTFSQHTYFFYAKSNRFTKQVILTCYNKLEIFYKKTLPELIFLYTIYVIITHRKDKNKL